MYALGTSASTQTGLCELALGRADVPRASSSHSRSGTSVTELPPEIWHRIFDFLFFIPGIFSTDAEEIEAYSEDSEGITLHGLYDDVMASKLAVGMVCKTWRIATLPSLFSYVKIVNRRHAILIADLFTHFKQVQSEGDYYGQWVRRLEVCSEDGFWDQESINAIAQALSLMPNIQVYSDFFSLNITRSSDDIVRKLQERCEGGRLRRIEWSGTIARDVVQLLEGTPSLSVLISRDMPRTALHLPSLKTLILRTSKAMHMSDMEAWRAPSLQSLIVHSHVLESDTCSVASALPSYPELTRLRWLRSPGGETELGCSELEHLKVLTLDLGLRKGDPVQLNKLQVKHQSLSRINIVHLPLVLSLFGGRGYDKEEPEITEFLNTLLNTDNLPALKAIGIYIPRSYFSRVYGEDKEDGARIHTYIKFWESFLKLCASRDIEVEASVGSEAHFWGTWQPFRIGLLPRYLR